MARQRPRVLHGIGTPLDAANVRRSFRRITKVAGLGADWTPRELRHSFVSIMSDNGVTIEQTADLVGHRTTIVTQKAYRHQLKPVISTGATTMNTIFNAKRRLEWRWLPNWLPPTSRASTLPTQ